MSSLFWILNKKQFKFQPTKFCLNALIERTESIRLSIEFKNHFELVILLSKTLLTTAAYIMNKIAEILEDCLVTLLRIISLIVFNTFKLSKKSGF